MSLNDKRCKCPFAIKMNGDGCQYCQPQTTIDFMSGTIEDLEAENEALRNELGEHRRNAALRWEKYKDPKATLYECKQRVGGDVLGVNRKVKE